MSLNIAHRGASGLYPENTMIAFQKAVQMKCDGMETDVQKTKDGVLVLCHDEKVDRTTDGVGYIKDYTFKDLRKLNANVKFADKCEKQNIPTLEELFEFVKGTNLYINLELKTGQFEYDGIEKEVIDMIYKYDLKNNIIISSFNHYSVLRSKEIDSSLKYGMLYDCWIYHPEKYVKALGVDACHPSVYSLNDETINDIHNEGLMINTYTVNEIEDMKRLMKFNVHGIITNFPNKLHELMK